MSEPETINQPQVPENQDKKKFGNLSSKDAAKRQLEEKGKKWDSADWAMAEKDQPGPPKT